MTEQTTLEFRDERTGAIQAIDSIGSGRGWCNLSPVVTEDVDELKVDVFNLWINAGVVVASFVTSRARRGAPVASSLGVLHTRGRLGRERIESLLAGAPFTLRQDHAQRGLLFDVPSDTHASTVVDVMCTIDSALCDYEVTGDWRLTVFKATPH